jgi:pSer/pThr/pTyr-binding forkhead associated (FHA) protein
MAYLVFSAKGHELGRRPLTESAVIGRSPECGMSVRDILLSRRHCQIERSGDAWVLTDLASKNGTFVKGERVERHTLKDGQSFDIGQTRVVFHAGDLAGTSADAGKPMSASRRPSDPFEALSGTVSGFDYAKTRMDAHRVIRKTARPLSMFPKPQPTPADPQSYAQEDLYSMLTEIAASSWDSIYSSASRKPVSRVMPRPVVRPTMTKVMTPQREVLEETTRKLLKKADRRVRHQRLGSAITRILKGVAAVAQGILILGPAFRR